MASRGRTGSMSSIEESRDTKVHFDDFDDDWSGVIDNAVFSLKRTNPDVKKVVFKGKQHPSSTVKEHTEIVSIQLRNKNEEYIGSAHLDKDGNVYPNQKFEKKAEERRQKSA